MDVGAKGIRQEEGRDAGVRRPNAAAASDVPWVGWWPYSYDASFASVRIRCLHPLAQLRRNGYPVEFFNPKNASSYDAVLFSEHLSQKSLHAAQELRQSGVRIIFDLRSEEHTSELQSLMRISYAVFCLKKKT